MCRCVEGEIVNKLLTVGVPAYNVEKYLGKCLDSLIDERIEVLVINDGSTDGTERIAKDYQARYPGIFRVISKPNGGWGSGVNLAIAEAKGKFFKNLDSDDCFDSAGLQVLLRNMEEHPADVMISPAINCLEDSEKRTSLQFPNGCVFEELIDVERLCSNIDFVFRMHTLAFKTELLQSRNIQFSECYYADLELCFFPFLYAKTAYVQKPPVYLYRVGREGQSMSLASMAGHMEDIERVSSRIVKAYTESGKESAYLEHLAKIALSSLFTQPMAIDDRNERNLWYDRIRAAKALPRDKGYSIFAKQVMKSGFDPSPLLIHLWRFSMGEGAVISGKIWDILRKI